MLGFLLLLFISIFPIFILGKYIYKIDKNKEPKKLIIKIIFFGSLSSLIAMIIEIILEKQLKLNDVFFNSLVQTVVVIALTEELCKFFISYFFGIKSKYFDEDYDAILYTASSALGFACLENVLYVLDNNITTGIFRAFLSVPGHLSYGIIMGYFIMVAHKFKVNNEKKLYIKNLVLSIIIPTIIHGMFDFTLLYSQEKYNVLPILLASIKSIILSIFSLKMAKKISVQDKKLLESTSKNNMHIKFLVIELIFFILILVVFITGFGTIKKLN